LVRIDFRPGGSPRIYAGEERFSAPESSSILILRFCAGPTPIASTNELAAAKSLPTYSPVRVHAKLELDFQFNASTRSTILASSAQTPPLKVVRAFPQDDGAALVHLHNVSGGLLGGDRLELGVRLGPAANVQLTTTGATRIYRPRRDAAATTQSNEITLAENSFLEYVPDAIIPYAGVRFEQQTKIHLSQGAGLFWWEILAPGREARGEIFEYESVEMRAEISAAGRPIALERIRLEPRYRPLASLARLGPYRYWATFYICHVGLAPAAWLAFENHLRETTRGLTRPGESLWGISTLVDHGLVVRCLAVHGRDVLPGLQSIWRAAKLHLYSREAVPPRKVP
jgi:urease accessory protein